ncbi:hypothetical protein [Altererythrobacter fulvus]|uniref:hypothetical protein n=1 Tax=Caenibius fulvus TaxID=2126012 RepID=UPI0030196830
MTLLRGFAITVVSAVAISPLAVSAQGEGQVLLQPLGEWEAQRLDDRCVMRRAFGNPERPTILELRRIDPWDGGFHAAITSGEFEFSRVPFKVAWLPGGRESLIDVPTYANDTSGREWVEFQHGLWDGKLDTLKGAALTTYFRDDGPARFQQSVGTYQITGAFGKTITLQTGPMASVVSGTKLCMEQMLAARGVDPRDMSRDNSRVVARHVPSKQRIGKFLPEAIATRARPSLVVFLLYLNANAQPTSCRLSSVPFDERLEAGGCDLLMKYASFDFKAGEQARQTFYNVSIEYR